MTPIYTLVSYNPLASIFCLPVTAVPAAAASAAVSCVLTDETAAVFSDTVFSRCSKCVAASSTFAVKLPPRQIVLTF